MLRKINTYSPEEKAVLFLYGINTMIDETDKEYQEYIRYKNNLLEQNNEDKILSMDALFLLENLGYNLNEVGTYLYKDLIVKVINTLMIISKSQEKESYDKLIQELKNPYSNFYHELARNEKDIGIKTFHACIIKSVSKMNVRNQNPDFIQEIYGNNEENLDYKENSILLAVYLLNHQQKAQSKNLIIKKLIQDHESI